MRLQCRQCGTNYAIADDKIRGEGRVFKIRCKSCSGIITFSGVTDPDQPHDTNVDEDAGPPTWYYVKDGGQVGPVTVAGLRVARAEGALQDETYVWQAGMGDWAPLQEVAELASVYGTGSSEPSELPDEVLDAIAAEAEQARGGEPTAADIEATRTVDEPLVDDQDQTILSGPPVEDPAEDPTVAIDVPADAFGSPEPAERPVQADDAMADETMADQTMVDQKMVDYVMADQTMEETAPEPAAEAEAPEEQEEAAPEPTEAIEQPEPAAPEPTYDDFMADRTIEAPSPWLNDAEADPAAAVEAAAAAARAKAIETQAAQEEASAQPAPVLETNATLDDLFVGDVRTSAPQSDSFFGIDEPGDELGEMAAGTDDDAMVWQRHDNSVLFSLTDLDEPAKPKPRENQKAKALAAITADSGLIDIRSFKKKKAAPSGDLFAGLAGGDAPSASPSAPAAPVVVPVIQRKKKGRVFAFLGIAAAIALAIGGTIFVMNYLDNQGGDKSEKHAKKDPKVAQPVQPAVASAVGTNTAGKTPGAKGTRVAATQPVGTVPTQPGTAPPPVMQPNQPVPGQPVAQPGQPGQPVAQPGQPVATPPGQPLAQPGQPVAQPNQPVAQPAEFVGPPVLQPGQPAVQPIPPPTKVVAAVTAPAAPKKPLTAAEKKAKRERDKKRREDREKRKKDRAEVAKKKAEEAAKKAALAKAAAKPKPAFDPNALLKKTVAPAKAEKKQAAPDQNLPNKLTAVQVRRVVRRAAGKIRRCVTSSGQSNVQVTTVFTIQPSGKVSGARVKGAVAASSAAGCVKSAIAGLRFPRFNGPAKPVTYPFFIK